MLEPLYYDADCKPRPLDPIRKQVKSLGIERYVPLALVSQDTALPPNNFLRPSDVEAFISSLRSIEQLLYENIPKVMGNGPICMNLTGIMTNFLAECYGFPVVGLYSPADERLEYYIRPTTSILDSRVRFPWLATYEPLSVEDFIEVKFRDTLLAIDFYLAYNENSPIPRILIEKFQHHNILSDKYGLYPTQYRGFSPNSIKDSKVRAFFGRKVSSAFSWMVGNPSSRCLPGDSDLKVMDYVNSLSSGALISQGYTPRDLSGCGRVWFPQNFDDRVLLLRLPSPDLAQVS